MNYYHFIVKYEFRIKKVHEPMITLNSTIFSHELGLVNVSGYCKSYIYTMLYYDHLVPIMLHFDELLNN